MAQDGLHSQRGTILVALSAILYSIGGLCIKVIPWNGIAINGGRTAIAVVVIGIYLLIIKHRLRFNRWILLGAFCVCSANLLFSLANKLTTAANAIVLQFTAPIFVILFSIFFFHRKLCGLDLAACGVIFGGILFFFLDSLSTGGGLGNLLALISGVSYAGVMMMNDMPNSDTISSVFWGDVFSAVIGLPFLVRETDFSALPLISLTVLGVFQVAIAYIFLTVGLKTTPPVTASLVSGLEPVLSPIWVALFYQETVGPCALIGCAIVVSGVVLYNVLLRKRERAYAGVE